MSARRRRCPRAGVARCWRCRWAAPPPTAIPSIRAAARQRAEQQRTEPVQPTGRRCPGSYQIDLYLNGQFLERDQIRFVRAGKQVLPCFDRPQLTRFGLKNPPAAAEAECLLPGRNLKDIAVNADISRLRLDLSIPQALLNGQPRGSVNPASRTAEKRWPSSITTSTSTTSVTDRGKPAISTRPTPT